MIDTLKNSAENNKANAEMAAHAESLMQQSQALLNQALGACQIEGFEAVKLDIPQVIGGGVDSVAPAPSQEQIWQQINQVYAQQSNLFTDEDLVDPVSATTDATNQPVTQAEATSTSPDEGLTDIAKMLGL